MPIDNDEKNFETSILRYLDWTLRRGEVNWLDGKPFQVRKKTAKEHIESFFEYAVSAQFDDMPHTYSTLVKPNETTLRESGYGVCSFLVEIKDLPDDSFAKEFLKSLFFSDDNATPSDFFNIEDDSGFMNRLPSYDFFCKNLADINGVKYSIYAKYEYKIKDLIEFYLSFPNNKYRNYSIKIHEPFYTGIYNGNTQQTTISENTKAVENQLSKKGFPYSKNYDEYERFLMQNKHICQLLNSQMGIRKTCRFPASKLMRILWKAPIDRNDFITHTYVVARSGSGKSEFLKTLIQEMGGSCILLDPHGDLANSLDGKKGFFKVAPREKRFVVNPFDITNKTLQNRELVAQLITGLIEELMMDTGLSHLMKTVARPVIQTLLKLPYADFAMLTACFNPVSGGEVLEKITPFVDETINNWDAILGDQHDNTKHSIFNRLVSFLNYSIVRDTVCGLDDFGQAIERVIGGENLVVSVPSPTLGEDVSEVLGRFFMCRMQIWAKSRESIPEHLRTPVFLIVDECQNFLSEMTAKTLDQFGRKFGLFMVLAHQHIKQIDSVPLTNSILTNCKNKIVGQASKATRQALASEMGLEQSDFEGLGRGYYWGTFENKGAIKFYSLMARFKDTRNGVQYATSQNRAYVNGWDIVGDDLAPDTRTHTKTQEKTRKTPKYDV